MQLISSIIKTALLALAFAALISSCMIQKKQDNTPCWKGAEPKHRTSKMKV